MIIKDTQSGKTHFVHRSEKLVERHCKKIHDNKAVFNLDGQSIELNKNEIVHFPETENFASNERRNFVDVFVLAVNSASAYSAGRSYGADARENSFPDGEVLPLSEIPAAQLTSAPLIISPSVENTASPL